MILRGTDYGVIHGASGVQNFFGEGWDWHRLAGYSALGPFALSFEGMTFVAKTTTLLHRPGNMPLIGGGTRPKEWLPRSIAVNPFHSAVVNSIGLSGPGAEWLFEQDDWQERTIPFFLSFMSVAATPEERLAELAGFVDMFQGYLPDFRTKVGLQLNMSCPNVEHAPDNVLQEATLALDICQRLGVPVLVKLSVTTPPDVAVQIATHSACDGICISNTVPWNATISWAPESLQINWWRLWLSHSSPVARKLRDPKKKGGLSGRPITKLVREWLRRFRDADIDTAVCAGGGVLGVGDARTLMQLGANAVFLGSMAILRPWRVQNTINTINREYGNLRKEG